jgi:hypothetical protein
MRDDSNPESNPFSGVAAFPAPGETVGVSLDTILASPLTGLLALVGCAAIVFRLARSLLRVGLAAAEAGAVGGMMRVSVRQGDLTGMAERQAVVAAVRRTRLLALATAAFWALLLVVPPLAGVARAVYAAAALVWLLPRRPIRLTTVAAQGHDVQR